MEGIRLHSNEHDRNDRLEELVPWKSSTGYNQTPGPQWVESKQKIEVT